MGRFGRFDRDGAPRQRLALERLGDPPQLTKDKRKSDQDQAARDRDRARDNERIAEAEGIDWNTKSDRYQAYGGRDEANGQQNESHRVSVPYQHAVGCHTGYQSVAAFRVIRKNLPWYSLSKSTID